MQAGMLQLHVAGGCEEVDAAAAWHDARTCWGADRLMNGRLNLSTRCLYAMAATHDDVLRNATLEVCCTACVCVLDVSTCAAQIMFGLNASIPAPPVKHTAGMLRVMTAQRAAYTNDTSVVVEWLLDSKARLLEEQQGQRLLEALQTAWWPATPTALDSLRTLLDMPACEHGGGVAACQWLAQQAAAQVATAASGRDALCAALATLARRS